METEITNDEFQRKLEEKDEMGREIGQNSHMVIFFLGETLTIFQG